MNDENISIDITASKLLEWLESRHHISKNWQTNLLNVRRKINNAIQDITSTPRGDVIELLYGQHINYFHCQQIVKILEETEKASKNIFGMYGSQRMKDWQDIISLYQKDNLYLAELAQILIRNVTYEIPSLKKHLQKLEQTAKEYEKKIKDCNKTENAALKEFAVQCESLGVKGKNLRKELIDIIKELPTIYIGEVEQLKTLQTAIDYYKAFIDFYAKQTQNTNQLEILPYLIVNENTTTYQYTYGLTPSMIVEAPLYYGNIYDNYGNYYYGNYHYGNYYYGEEQVEKEVEQEIDFGGYEENPENIDWGDSTDSKSSFEMVDLNDDIDEQTDRMRSSRGGVATGDEALTLLDNPKYREQVINEVLQLEAFLKIRLHELSTDPDDLLTVKQLETAPMILEMQTVESVQNLLDGVVDFRVNYLMNQRTQHLFNLKHHPKYVDVLIKCLSLHLSVAEKMRMKRDIFEKKLDEIRKEIEETKPMIQSITTTTKEIQKQIEEVISKKYNGRVTNIVGSVNML